MTEDWRPTTTPAALTRRAQLMATTRAFFALDAERLLLVGVDRAEADGGEQSSVRHAVESGQLLGEHHRVSSG